MEGSVENSVTKPQEELGFGLGFQSSTDNDLDKQTTNEEHRNQQLLEILSEEIRLLVLEEKERENESDDNVNKRVENGLGFCVGNDEGVGEEAAPAPAGKDGRQRIYYYPVRPGAEDCAHYMRTGTCKFGKNCKFNHQRRRKYQVEWKMDDLEFCFHLCGCVLCCVQLEMHSCLLLVKAGLFDGAIAKDKW